MKLIILFILASCAQKYQTYHVIDKYNFDKDNPSTPITKKLIPLPGKKQTAYCEGQVLFLSNAKRNTDKYLSSMLRTMCPNKQYVLNSKLTETWWTTIFYSRSCVKLEGYCPKD